MEMTLKQLCEKIRLDSETTETILKLDEKYDHTALAPLWEKLYSSDTWEEGIQQLQEHLGEDPNGFKILTCLLYCAIYTWQIYCQKGISEQIFVETMGFVPRFILWQQKVSGQKAFVWAWWFPRQLSLQEFRIGELEYELTGEGTERRIYMHIPSDAVLEKDRLQASQKALKEFLQRFFPEYTDAPLFCDSWLLSPALRQLLPETSRIYYFQSCFDLLKTEENSPAFMDWLYLRRDIPCEQLPEKTSLQRRVKAHLLAGGKIGWTLGQLRQF